MRGRGLYGVHEEGKNDILEAAEEQGQEEELFLLFGAARSEETNIRESERG